VLSFKSPKHGKDHIATFKLYWWQKTLGTPLCIISDTKGHPNRTIDVPKERWIILLHDRIQGPKRDLNPQWEGQLF
jgi:hypothetical protein